MKIPEQTIRLIAVIVTMITLYLLGVEVEKIVLLLNVLNTTIIGRT